MKGICLSEQAKIVNILPAIDISGGKTSQYFSMKEAAHATIILSVGVSAAAWTKIIVNAASDNSGTGAEAKAFALYPQETAGAAKNVLGTREAVAAAGRTPSAADNIFYTIEIDASELPDGKPYVALSLTNGANSVIAAAIAVLTGFRFVGAVEEDACA